MGYDHQPCDRVGSKDCFLPGGRLHCLEWPVEDEGFLSRNSTGPGRDILDSIHSLKSHASVDFRISAVPELTGPRQNRTACAFHLLFCHTQSVDNLYCIQP